MLVTGTGNHMHWRFAPRIKFYLGAAEVGMIDLHFLCTAIERQ